LIISNTLNQSADYWYYDIGVNVIPANTKRKETYESWSQWQVQSISKEVHESRKKRGYYNNGIAIIPGPIWRGPYNGKYLVAIDLDNRKAKEEFCRNGLEELKQQTLVEKHADPDKIHIYFIVEREIPNKTSDKTDSTKSENIKANEIPAIEVKNNGKGIMYCADSPHPDGSNYHLTGTRKPKVFKAQDVEDRIRGICNKYNLTYGFTDNSNDYNNNSSNNTISLSIQELFLPGTKILKGHNRHLGILRVMDSLLLKNMNFLTLEEIKQHTHNRNSELCVPPLDKTEIDKLWKQAYGYAIKKIKEIENSTKKKQQERNKKIQQQHQQKPGSDYEEQEHGGYDENQGTTTIKSEKQQLIEEGTQLVMSKNRFLTIEESKEILFYDDNIGVYNNGGEIVIEKELEDIFGFKLRTSDITEIKNHVMRQTYTKRKNFDANLDIINLKNGLYNIRTGILEHHSPDYYSLNQKPFSYNPKARPKYFIKFLKEVLWIEDIPTAIDIIAYTFLRYNPYEFYFILIGTGANGKSVYTGMLTNLHGLKNVSNVSLDSLVDDRFALADLENKDVNIDTELSSTTIKDMSTIKKLTGKQPIRIQRKQQHAYDTVLHAKLIFNANQMPANPDNSDAHFRREIPLSFPFQFEGEREDPDLLQKLSTEEELSGIFNIIAHNLRTRFTKNQRVRINQKTIKERREKAELIRNPIKSFTTKAIAKDSVDSDYETKEDMHHAFRRYCKFYKLPVEQKETFGGILKKKPYEWKDGKKQKDGNRKTIWKGKRLKEKWKNDTIFLQQTFDSNSRCNYDIDEEEESEEKGDNSCYD
jgi:P4 family phage/plasmid primase-like protien